LSLPDRLYGIVPIRGTANGTNFTRYRIEYAPQAQPENWTEIHSSSAPVADGVLFDGFLTSELPDGVYTFRVIAEGRVGEVAMDRKTLTVSNVHVDFPLNNDFFRAGETLEIRGSVFGAGRTFRIEYSEGLEPTTWNTGGLNLFKGGTEPVPDGLLATWNTRSLPRNQFYALKLTGLEGDRIVGEQIVRWIYLDERLKPGWPQYLPITSEFPTNDWRSITVADLAGDGFKELVLVDPGDVDGKVARLLVYKFDGTLLWSRDLGTGEPYWDVPVVGDMDGDGRLRPRRDDEDGSCRQGRCRHRHHQSARNDGHLGPRDRSADP
jgi:hypothetical protein